MGDERGVEVRATSIRLHFSAGGVKHKHTLKINGKPMQPTPANIKYAGRLIAEIRGKIRHGTFSVAEYFPEDGTTGQGLTVSAQLDTWMASQRIATSTRKAYGSACRFWKAAVGDEPVRTLKLSQLLTPLAESEISGKTANNYTSVLREALELAVADGVLDRNPAAQIEPQSHQRQPPDPFTPDEVEAILAAMPAEVVDDARFRFFTGLRTGEHLALEWSKVHLDQKVMVIDAADVRGERTTTKTDRARTVLLNSVARSCLERQQDRARKGVAAVWLDPRYGTPWSGEHAFREAFWIPALAVAGVRYRRPYVTRHTYATLMLMSGMKPAFCAKQMGHGVDVFERVYSRWIDGVRDASEMDLLEATIARFPSGSPEPRSQAEGDGSRTRHLGKAYNPLQSPAVPATGGAGGSQSPEVPLRFPPKFPKEVPVIVAESIKICERTLKSISPEPDAPAIVAAPTWWISLVKSAGGAEQGEELDQFCGCKVVVKDDLPEPSLVAADGRVWSLLPHWARAREANPSQPS